MDEEFKDMHGRTVSDAEFNAAWGRKDNKLVIRDVLTQFRLQLDQDELDQCALSGLWKTLAKHDDNHPSGQKFTTSLYRYVTWACLNVLQSKTRYEKRGDKASEREMMRLAYHAQESVDKPLLLQEKVETVLCSIPEGFAHLLKMHFLEHKTVKEIALLQGRSVESVKLSLEEALGMCRTAV